MTNHQEEREHEDESMTCWCNPQIEFLGFEEDGEPQISIVHMEEDEALNQ